MKHYRLSTGKEVFIGSPSDGFTVATYAPDKAKPESPEFRVEFPGSISLTLRGKEADEMRDGMQESL